MKRLVALALIAWASAADGQTITPAAPMPIDTSNLATKGDLAGKADASALAAKADTSSLPSTCSQPPAPDAMTATAGVGTPCTPRIDAARQTPIPPASAVTASDGSFSGTWGMTLTAPPSRAIATVEGSTPKHCQIITRTTSGFTGKCWDIAPAITMDAVLTSLLGSVKTILTPTAAGTTVTILARQ